jgi:large-conductance mechanosensitive channel
VREPVIVVTSARRSDAVLKKVLGWLVIAFVVFYVIKAPESSAEIVRSAGQALGDAASSLAAFVGSLA